MRRAYRTLRFSLHGYWGYAPVRPYRRSQGQSRFEALLGDSPVTPPSPRSGGLNSPTPLSRRPLTPLANPTRRPVGGFDSRLGPLKGRGCVRGSRRLGPAMGAQGTGRAVLAPFVSGRGGWGTKSRRGGDLLRADTWAPLSKRGLRPPVGEVTVLWGPTLNLAHRPRGLAPLRLAVRSSLEVEGEFEGGGGAGRPLLHHWEYAQAALWCAGLRGQVTPVVTPPPRRPGRLMAAWL
jgi:hypothetical protein